MPCRHPVLVFAVAALGSILASPAGAGEADGPWAQLLSATPKTSDPTQYAVGIYAIDGRWSLSPKTYVQIEPGGHRILVMEMGDNASGLVTQVELPVDAKPCMAYHLLGVYARGTSDPAWRPVVVTERPIKRCMKKFGIAPPDTTTFTPTP